MALWVNYQQDPDKAFLREAFPKLEKYIEWDREYGKGPNPSIKYLLKWGDAGDAGMDVSTGRLPTTTHATRTRHGNLLTVCVVVAGAQHEQNFCPGGTYWHKGDGQWGTQCSADHYALDFANYIIWEAQTLTKMATELGLKPRAEYWTAVAVSTPADDSSRVSLAGLRLHTNGSRCDAGEYHAGDGRADVGRGERHALRPLPQRQPHALQDRRRALPAPRSGGHRPLANDCSLAAF